MMGLSKLYDRLDAKERTAALLAALVRGDDIEQERLNATAPRRSVRRLHHHGRVQAVWSITSAVRIEQLATLSNLWHAQARLAWAIDNAEVDGAADDPVSDDPVREVRTWKAFVNVYCWRLSINQTAWGIVCERLDIAPEFLNEFGDCIALQLTETRLADNTPSADTVRERLAEFGQVGELLTAESIAAEWLAVFDSLND